MAHLLLPTRGGVLLRSDVPISAQDDTAPDSEGVEVALQYKIVPAVVKTIGFVLNEK